MDCKFLAKSFDGMEFSRVLREKNKCADFLVNHGQTYFWGTKVLEDPLNEMIGFLLVDAEGVRFMRTT